MSLVRRAGACAGMVVACCAVAAGQSPRADVRFQPPRESVPLHVAAPVTFQQPPTPRAAIEHLPLPALDDSCDPFAGHTELPLGLLVDEVLARNPSVAAAAATWRAAAARFPQVVSLDDPMLDTIMAPGSIGAADMDFGYALQGRQKVPWFGKRQLRGAVAQHEARAAYYEVADARLQLIEAAQQAFYEYFMARRLLEWNAANRAALAQFKQNALSRYEANLVSQQDVLLAEVELAEAERRQLELVRADRVATARINTLLVRDPMTPLLPPPQNAPGVMSPTPPELLRQLALEQRPDLAAAMSRLRAEQAGVALAEREFKPDVELVGRYDTFWLPQNRLVGQVGLTVNVPLALERRRAAVREAMAKVSQRRAELDRLAAQVQFEVQQSYERLEESRKIVLLYNERIVPAATESVQSAQIGYQTSKLDFLRLVEAQRQLIGVRERQAEALAEYHGRLAELERLIGGATPELSPGEAVGPGSR